VASAFQLNLSNPANIRLRPDLEPYRAIGDACDGCPRMRRARLMFADPDGRHVRLRARVIVVVGGA
jgi:hypothetical protein